MNQEKFETFAELAEMLNKAFGIKPVLYGSLGLSRIIKSIPVNDIDILVPGKLLKEEWGNLVKQMNAQGFELSDEKEHEFKNEKGIIVGFAPEEDLQKLSKIDPNELPVQREKEAEFRNPTAEQYLTFYQRMLRDNYRQEKRGKADKEKIRLIKKYLRR